MFWNYLRDKRVLCFLLVKQIEENDRLEKQLKEYREIVKEQVKVLEDLARDLEPDW